MSNVQISDAQIAEAAFFLWLDEGQPEGRDAEHWFRAAERLSAVAAPAKPARKPRKAAAAKPKAAATKKAAPKAKATKTDAPKTKTTRTRKSPAN